jgi:hypothetical protein
MDDPVVDIEMLYGNCPVQADGTINGHKFYFRARGQHWTLEVGGDDPCDKCDWSYREKYSDEQYAAGWITEDEARSFIARGAAIFANEGTISCRSI